MYRAIVNGACREIYTDYGVFISTLVTRERAYPVYNSSRIVDNIKHEYHFSKLLVHLENCIDDRVLLVIRWNNRSA